MAKDAAEKVFKALSRRHMSLSTAESLTGGLIGARITSVPGVSQVYGGGVITYSSEEKHQLIQVSSKTLKKEGAISRKCAKEMALGCAKLFGSDCSIAVTGNAGPTGSEDKPVGLVYIGVCIGKKVTAREYRFSGDRQSIREQTAEEALKLLLHALKDGGKGKGKDKNKGEKAPKKAQDEAAGAPSPEEQPT